MDIANLPVDGPQGPTTIKGYLVLLLKTLLEEEEGFSGKRPFGDSAWKHDLYKPLIVAGAVRGKLDSDNYIEEIDEKAADKLLLDLVSSL